MPAEWEPHAGTWFTWPRPDGISFPDKYDSVPPVYAELIRHLAGVEEVNLNVWDADMEARARELLRRNGAPVEQVRFHHFPAYEPWCRDHGPIFLVHPHGALGGEGLFFAFIVGTVAGLASGLLTALVYGFEDIFTKLPIHWMWWPAIGGLCVGIGGLIEPSVLGVGYDTIHKLLLGDIVGPALLALLIGKSLVWAIALGSGTSGGVLAPLLMMGGALGAAMAPIIPLGDGGLWAAIGMAAMMGGTMRSPLTSMIFTLELTQDLNLLPGLLVGCIAAHGVTVLLLRRSILTEKVARRGFHVMREYSVDPLTMVRVGEVMDRRVPTVSATMPVLELSKRIAAGDTELTRHEGLLIVDDQQQLVGIITRGDIVRAIEQIDQDGVTVLDAGSRDVVITYADEVLAEASLKMLGNSIGRLPVVTRKDPRRIVGYLGRSQLMMAHQRRIDDEHVREQRFLKRRETEATPVVNS
jgi:CBS domain-containing protein